jgi:hypothetical protein
MGIREILTGLLMGHTRRPDTGQPASFVEDGSLGMTPDVIGTPPLAHQVRAKFKEALDEERVIAEAHMRDPRFKSPLGSGPNVGHWELVAVRYASDIDLDPKPEDLDNVGSYVDRLLRELEEVKRRFRALEQDDDGFGIGTLHNLTRRLREQVPEHAIENEQAKHVPVKPSPASFLSDLREEIPELLRRDELLLALDTGQLYIFAICLHLLRERESLAEEEKIYYTKHLCDARSILVRAIVKHRCPSVVLSEYYRYVVGVSNVLAVLQTGSEPSEMDVIEGERVKLPFVPFGASFERAQAEGMRRMEGSKSSFVSYNDDIPHYHIFRKATDLQALASDEELKYLASMFPHLDEVSLATRKSGVLLHYFAIKDYTDDWKESVGDGELLCLKVDFQGSPLRVSGWMCGAASDAEALCVEMREAAERAVQIGSSYSEVGAETTLEALSWLLWPPYEDDIPAGSSIFICADGALALVPFAALIKESKVAWCEDHPLVLVSRLQACNGLGDPDFTTIEGIVIANPDFSSLPAGSYPDLPGTAREGDLICGLCDWSIIDGKGASVENTLDAIEAYPVVHIATHGQISDNSNALGPDNAFMDPVSFFRTVRASLDSAAVVLHGEDSPQRLSASTMSALRFPLSELVFLSLCNGGAGMSFGSELPFSIARALIMAGSKRVVASLYSVDDAAACEIAVEFHARLRSGIEPAEALRLSQIALIERGFKWHVWGGYQMIC